MLAYDGLIIDLDGVIWRGRVPIDGAAEAIGALRERGVRLVFMTNEPGSSRIAFAARLTGMGIPATSGDVLTSAAATARAIASRDGLRDRRIFVIGPHALVDEVRAAGLDVVTGEQARSASVVVVGAHQGFDYQELRTATLALRNGAHLFATGRDVVFPSADGPWPGTGAVLAAVETAGGVRAEVIGKPEAVMFELARQTLSGCERIGVVGDNLSSDIAGAKRAGLAAILVLTGGTSRADLDEADVRPDVILETIADLPMALAIDQPTTPAIDQPSA
jgi:glycerol-1-phosphatase